ncbi:MAG: hypothetical protein AA931_11440 [Peptococcaceae bacterium 1109]|jgi:hypothetical protein|nr:MAG: hypothetical protein AA931_11440 [Peptococcaceae bacterium 1109]
MISPSITIALLGLVTALVALGFGERVLERMRLSTASAIVLLLAMVGAHFLPAWQVTPGLTIHLGALILLGIVAYLITTTSAREAARALIVGLITGAAIWLSDKLLPVDPSSRWFILDPVFVGGIAAGLISYALGRSRRSAFCGAILGLFFVDIANALELMQAGINQPIQIGGGGLLASIALNPLIAVAIAEAIGEIRERLHRGPALPQGGDDDA